MTRLTPIILALVALLVCGVAGNGHAKDGERLSNFKQLCISDASTGFNWENGGWYQTSFKASKYVVSKITTLKNDDEAFDSEDPEEFEAWAKCLFAMGRKETENTTYKRFNACLKIQEVGQASPNYTGCSETHTKTEGKWEVRFTCDDFKFRPNGNFHLYFLGGTTETKPKDDYKDSLSITVGKCADITD